MMRFIQKAFLMFCAAALSLSAPVSTFASETEGPGAIEEHAEEPVSDAPTRLFLLSHWALPDYS